jgi:hypothetical protein
MTLLGFTLLFNKRLAINHPYTLYGVEMLAMALYYQVLFSLVYQNVNIFDNLHALLLPFGVKLFYNMDDPNEYYEYARSGFNFNRVIYRVDQWVTLVSFSILISVHFLVILDLNRIVEQPFKPQRSRYKAYVIGTFFNIIAWVAVFFLGNLNRKSEIFVIAKFSLTLMVYTTMIVLFFRAIWVMQKQRTAYETRRSIIITYALSLLQYSSHIFISFIDMEDVMDTGYEWANGIKVLTRYLCCISCLILVAVRLSDPLIKQEVRRIATLQCRKKVKKKMLKRRALTTFLNSQINNEYVCIILEGISAVLRHREYQGQELVVNRSHMEGDELRNTI